MKKLLLMLFALITTGAWAQTDVTKTYITNADFSSMDGWTQDHSSQYWSLGNGLIGTYAVANDKKSTTDDTHLATEYCLGMQCRWQTNYAAFTQTTSELPVGVYTLVYDVQNTNGSTKATYENRFTVKVGGTTYTDSKTEWMNGSSSWTTHSITFEVTEATTAAISLGYGTSSNNFGTGATPHLYVSHLKMTYIAQVVKTTLEAAIATATAVNKVLNNDDLATAITTAQNVYDKADATQSEVNTAVTDLNEAVATAKQNISNETNITSLFVTNNSFETGDLTGWSVYSADDTGVRPNSNTTYTTTGVDGDYLFNTWGGNAAKYIKQTLTGLPEGYYEVSALIASDKNLSVDLLLGNSKTEVATSPEGKGTFVTGTTDKVYFNGEGSLVIGVSSTNWYKADNFQVTYYTVDAVAGEVYNTALVAAQAINQDAPMNANALTTLQKALNDYGSLTNPTNSDYSNATTALQAATISATASIAAYVVAKTAVDKANAIKEAHNFATADATTTFENAISQIWTAYEAGTLSDDDANNAGTTLGVSVSDWHANANGAAVNYMENGFGLNDFDAALYINTWSTEGDNDGSNFSVPFYEYWTDNANSLGANTWTGTLNNLENGLYKVTAWVRVRAKDETAAEDATGITMDVNGGAAIDVTEGDLIGESSFTIDSYEAEGLVKDGVLKVNFNITENNISWLSIKNVHYEKLRDLTPEESAVAPTAIALDATAEMFVGNTLILAPTFTPENATTNATWTSSDETVATVANGVVTALKYGKATITITSTIDTEISASCEVTVTAPLITEAENLDFAEGPVKDNMITTYAKDMETNNTTYSQMQKVNGWSFGVANGDARAAGIMAYASENGMGANANTFYAPATNPAGETTGNVLGMVGVWQASVQYVQNVKLSAGVYTITVPVYRNGGASALTKNLIGVILDDGTEHLATTTTYKKDEWTTEIIKFTVEEDTYGKLSLGLNAPNKGSNESQRLWIDGVTVAYEPFATAEEIAALNTAIEEAEAKKLGFEKDDYAPYKNVEALTALAEAKALDTANPIAQSDVTNATTALESASWTANTEEVNAVYDGTLKNAPIQATSENVVLPGWVTKSGNTRQTFKGTGEDGKACLANADDQVGLFVHPGTYNYGETFGYTMPLKAGQKYLAEAKYCAWADASNNNFTLTILKDGETIATKSYGANATACTEESALKHVKLYFDVEEAGDYVLSVIANGNTFMTDFIIKKAVAKNLELDEETTCEQTEEKYANVAITRKIKAGLNTVVLPFALDANQVTAMFGEGAEVYAYSEDSENANNATVNFNKKDEATIEANVPVLVKATTASSSQEVEGVVVKTAEAKVTGKNFDFVGTYAPIETIPAGDYFIGNGALYKSAGSTSMKAFRAYIKAKEAAPSNVKLYIDGVATAISEINADVQESGLIYNLAGQRVSKATKGIFIKNGRKVVVK